MIEKLNRLAYKEWIKTRWYMLIALAVSLGMVIYIFFSIKHELNVWGATQYFANIILEKGVVVGKFKFIPVITALLIGLPQFVPEVTEKRIKLSLHLPMNNTAVIYSMVLYGFAAVAAILTVATLLLTLLMSICFPAEIIIPELQTIVPWILGGISCYFFIAMIAMEPLWRFRFVYMIFAFFVLRLFFLSYGLGNAVTAYPVLIAVTLIASSSILFTSHRFNKGDY